MTNKKTTVFLLTFFFLLSAGFMYYFYKTTKGQPKHLPVLGVPGHKVGAFAFTNQDGKTVTNKDLDGKIYVAEYFFTTCKSICPKMNDNMAKVFQEFRGNNDFMILSHTVDPEHDSVNVLAQYAGKFEADPHRWAFLTGDKKELYDMARYSYLVTVEEAPSTQPIPIEDDFIHTERFVLVDKQKQIRGSYDGTNPQEVQQMIGDIKELMKED
jgi:protein SCO1/2